MTRTDLMQATGAMIAALRTADFPAALAQLLRCVAPYDYTVCFGYHGSARPSDLHDDLPAAKRKVFVEDYQAGPYLLDPFYLAATRPVGAGLYRMRDLAPDRFYQGEYFRSYYVQTGLAEEIGYFVDLPDGSMIVLSLMRAERAFSSRDLRALTDVSPIVAASLRQHWNDVALRLDAGAGQTPDHGPLTRIEASFQTFGDGVLTNRERQIVEHTLQGHSAAAVGQILSISPGTVRIHRRNIYAKLRINSQGELFSKFIGTLGQIGE
ncbi:MAG: helix-turn-helix transcriptional regulator [bacterium]